MRFIRGVFNAFSSVLKVHKIDVGLRFLDIRKL